jgi:RecA/RadA recombinase
MELLQLRYKTPSMLKPITAAQLWERLGGRSATMTTGLSRLDTFLGGGLACGEITEIVGPSASGKTQFCALLAAAAVIQSGKRVLILDTGSSLMASRVVEIARNRATRDISELMDGIMSFNVFNIFDALDTIAFVLSQVERRFVSDGGSHQSSTHDGNHQSVLLDGHHQSSTHDVNHQSVSLDGCHPSLTHDGNHQSLSDGGIHQSASCDEKHEFVSLDENYRSVPRDGNHQHGSYKQSQVSGCHGDTCFRNTGLIIVDCVYDLVSPILTKQHTEGHMLMCELAQGLRRLTHVLHACTVVTNCSLFGGIASSHTTRPALGKTWGQVPSTRIALSSRTGRNGDTDRELRMLKSDRIHRGSVFSFTIGDAGIL